MLVILFAPIIAWISSWLLYGYGQLIENSDIIAEEYKRANEKYEKVVAKNNAREQKRIAENKQNAMRKQKQPLRTLMLMKMCSLTLPVLTARLNFPILRGNCKEKRG